MRSFILICWLLIGCLNVQSQVKVSAALDNSKILIGDHARLHLEAEYPSDTEMFGTDLTVLDSIFSEIDQTKEDQEPGLLEILEQTEWETLEAAGTTTYRKYVTLTCWKEGVYFIPQIRFIFDKKETRFTRATNKLTLLVSSPIEQTAARDTIQIAPIKDIVEEQWQLSDLLPVLYILLAFVLVFGGIIALILFIVKKRQAPPLISLVKRPAHKIAFLKLAELKNQGLWQKGEVKAYQSQLTYIIREYIENRYETPALESTSSVILSDLKKVDFPNSLVEKMREMLQLADMVKFAKAKPAEEMHTRLMGYAEEIVGSTKKTVSFQEENQLRTAAPGTQETILLTAKYAHPGARFLAYIIDGVIFQMIFGFLFFLVWMFVSVTTTGLPTVFFITLLIYFFLGFFYFALFHSKKKQTLGKMIVGIEVVHVDGSSVSLIYAFARFFVKVFSYLLLFLPFLPLLFNKQKQGLHDMIADTIVLKKM